MTDEEIHGHWHKISGRCEKCGRPAKQLMVVNSGPTTGKFCGPFCFNAAREEMKNENI